MTHVTPHGAEDVPNVRGVVGWVLFTWVTSVVGVAVAVWQGEWAAAAYAVNAAVCAAGWWLSASQWAEWRAAAEALAQTLATWREDGRP